MPTSSVAVVAVVEDDADMRKAICRVLEMEGFMTETYSTAEDFLQLGAESRASCIVLDVQLPGASGIDLYQRLRSSGCTIPTVFVTAQSQRPRGLDLQQTDSYLTKPFPAESLVAAVNRSIDGPRKT